MNCVILLPLLSREEEDVHLVPISETRSERRKRFIDRSVICKKHSRSRSRQRGAQCYFICLWLPATFRLRDRTSSSPADQEDHLFFTPRSVDHLHSNYDKSVHGRRTTVKLAHLLVLRNESLRLLLLNYFSGTPSSYGGDPRITEEEPENYTYDHHLISSLMEIHSRSPAKDLVPYCRREARM